VVGSILDGLHLFHEQSEDFQKALDELDDVQAKVEACREKLIKESRERNRLHGLCQASSPITSRLLLSAGLLHHHFFIICIHHRYHDDVSCFIILRYLVMYVITIVIISSSYL